MVAHKILIAVVSDGADTLVMKSRMRHKKMCCGGYFDEMQSILMVDKDLVGSAQTFCFLCLFGPAGRCLRNHSGFLLWIL